MLPEGICKITIFEAMTGSGLPTHEVMLHSMVMVVKMFLPPGLERRDSHGQIRWIAMWQGHYSLLANGFPLSGIDYNTGWRGVWNRQVIR